LLDAELAELRRRHLSPRELGAADVTGETAETLESAVQRAEQRRDRIGPVNPLAEQECAEMEERAGFWNEQRRDLESSMAQLQDVILGLDEHINGAFMEIFGAASENFETVIATIFPGAKGSLTLTEGEARGREDKTAHPDGEEVEAAEEDEAAPGIALSVKFPNKAPRSMTLLSGGEKAMTAIAFLFSLFLARPCPFYILDEVEASLDDVNIRRFLSLIRRYRDKTQFIVITHQRQTMEIADTLYGVALESDGTSRVLSRRLGSSKRPGPVQEQQHAAR
jgi:chromosome segregation protein